MTSTRTRTAFRVLLLCTVALCIHLGASEISETRMKKVSAIIARFKEAGEDLSDPDVRAAVFKEISKFYPLDPESKANLVGREEIAKMVREKVALKFPDAHDIVQKRARENAEKTFKRAKVNDYIKVTYEEGSKSYTVEGYFFGYGAMEHSINIGGNIIAIFDLVPKDRAKFDEKYREMQKEQFVQKQIRDYYFRKNEYSVELLKQEREAVVKYNENAGYIFAMNKWMTPRELATALADSMASQGQVAKIDPVPTDEPGTTKPPASVPTTTTPPDKPGETPATTTTQESRTKRIADTRRKAEADQQRIKTRYAGIDADQGYGNAIWWMKHADVNLLFDSLVDRPGEGNSETITMEKGPVQKVDLNFFHGYFYKVVVSFRIAAPQAMEILYRKIVETYGKTDQEKQEEEAARLAAEAAAAAPPAPPEGKKEGEAPPPPPEEVVIPEEITLTWTGKETIGSLYVKLTPDKKAYSAFVLTKENPKIVEEVKALIEKERKKKTDEELKKLLDEYGNFKVK